MALTRDEQETELWDRMPGEPKNWFLRFQRYYLYRGLARSVRRAYVAFLKENYPSKADDMIISKRGFATWMRNAITWNWKARAEAWDEDRNSMLQNEVLQASRFLMSHANDAAEALVDALQNSRLTVSAANSLLDRVGLPTVSKQELTHHITQVSADELARVKEDIEKWEQEQGQDQ